MGPAKWESPTSHSSAVHSSEPQIISLYSPTENLFSAMKRIKMDLCFCRKKQAYYCNELRGVLVMNSWDPCPQTLRCWIGREVCRGVSFGPVDFKKINSSKTRITLTHTLCPLTITGSVFTIYKYLPKILLIYTKYFHQITAWLENAQ